MAVPASAHVIRLFAIWAEKRKVISDDVGWKSSGGHNALVS